jgi:hypothetical protein
MVAGTEEMARLIERAATGDEVPPTRSFAERERPWRALLAHGRLALASLPTLAEARRVPRPDDDLLALWGRRPAQNDG